jgi:hypothetical protein
MELSDASNHGLHSKKIVAKDPEEQERSEEGGRRILLDIFLWKKRGPPPFCCHWDPQTWLAGRSGSCLPVFADYGHRLKIIFAEFMSYFLMLWAYYLNSYRI